MIVSIPSRKWRIIIFCFLLVFMLVSPSLGAVQWTRNGDYVTDDLQSARADLDAGCLPDGTSGGVTTSSTIDTDKNEYWLNLTPFESGTIGNFGAIGTTNLPPETRLVLGVYSTVWHPTPKHYDWSHERAEGQGKVFRSGIHTQFSGSINTSLLYPGEYEFLIDTTGSAKSASTFKTIDIIPTIPTTPGRMHTINWSLLHIPTLHSFNSIKPEINSWWKIVERARVNTGEVSYGSVIYCAWDGICRVYDRDGIQYYAAYDGMSITEVPNNSCISYDDNIMTVSREGCNDNIILTKIYEHMWDWEK